MPALESLHVFQALNRSPNARLEACAELGDGVSAALWSNHHDAQDYQAPSHHTLSCYIGGGTGTFRREQPGTKGGPDKLCILPAEHQSAWVINGEIRLAHVYFSPEQFALGCVTLLDREPRTLQLRESTFLEDPSQARRFHQLIALNWQEPAERLLTSSLAHEMLSHTLLSQVGVRDGLHLKGGLAAHLRRRLVEYIEHHLEDPISLGQLAGMCALSEYHFARMFRQSFGLPPHQYLLARRLARAQTLLRGASLPLGEIALACGFSSASHFTHRFRQALGATPGEYRQAFCA
ncbi:AraC family transcriptional regulator [Pseudomonas fluorescens]|jgi:AraC family transcriptional regulator|uniref:Helix-turn-helix transcriptional regulator n=3 Tax=Pseudomonas TaxID=286 RepID=A0A5M8F7N4_PSEVE|nr:MULTISPECIES: AraC family transcriptional regulator [Pseudomonas]AHC37793.1 AraC family transcriptional regulator [Pseudomonas sp. TKP]AOE70030.1 AraC family transcriptional regulator [Pseudomonas fluorescens]AOE75783.1 AraC family transcriptional regulator [Pseudomonas fluorescens]KAA6166588.1 helix-turn-helix transcriptional regulator [Pseudomonas veronii]KAA6168232.1 helix-turn-helix transcriptional regulator [Pseudomonas veronii]